MPGVGKGEHLDRSWESARELGGLGARDPGVTLAPPDAHRATDLVEPGDEQSGVLGPQLGDLPVERALPARGAPWSSQLVDPRRVEACTTRAGDVLVDEGR